MKLAVLGQRPEIFYTLQGEGISQGQPAVFVRLSLCNLHCVWCDTPYTWRFNDNYPHTQNKVFRPADEVLRLNTMEILEEVMKYPHHAHIVVTGGEPLLQDEELSDLLKHLKHRWIEVETNGTIWPKHCGVYVSQFNISPKLKSSGNDTRRNNEDAMLYFTQSYKSMFKFVIVSQDDLDEVTDLIRKYKIDRDKIILMPEGVTENELKEKALWISEICKERGFRFSTRLHVFLYGQKRGT